MKYNMRIDNIVLAGVYWPNNEKYRLREAAPEETSTQSMRILTAR